MEALGLDLGHLLRGPRRLPAERPVLDHLHPAVRRLHRRSGAARRHQVGFSVAAGRAGPAVTEFLTGGGGSIIIIIAPSLEICLHILQ